MVSIIHNQFYRGIVKGDENNPHPRFRFVLVDTVKEIQDENGNWYTDSFEYYEDYLMHNPDFGDVFYGVYGSFHLDNIQSGIKITETQSLQEAISIAENIMGQKIQKFELLY